MSDNKEPVRVQLDEGITAQVDWQPAQAKPFWLFGFIDDDCVSNGDGECYQPCMLGGDDPLVTIYQGIFRYKLPLPIDEAHRESFYAWLSASERDYHYDPDQVEDEE